MDATTITCPHCGHSSPLSAVPPPLADYPRQSVRCPHCGDGWLHDHTAPVGVKQEQQP